MLCEFNLPSDQTKKIRLNEATVSDAIDFSSIHPEREERVTTLFLNRMQDKETFVDSKLWTGEDRRYALFQYFIHTSKYTDIPLTWKCSKCGKNHTKGIPLAKINNDFTPIKGLPFREFPLNGHNVIVHPLTGGDLEFIENFREDLVLREKVLEENRKGMSVGDIQQQEDEIRARRVRMDMLRVLCCLDMKYLDNNGTPESRRSGVEKELLALPASQFYDLLEKIEESLIDMRHGLRTSYDTGRIYLVIPDVRCIEHPDEVGDTLRYPFRFSAVIPTI